MSIRVREVATWVRLTASLAVSLLAGAAGGAFTAEAVNTWYPTLRKPPFTPPDWLFAPVWTVLYILMGIALFLVWSRGFARRDVRVAMLFFGIQLVLNAAWSWIFFGMRSPAGGLAGIIVLWTALLLTILSFSKISPAACLLLIPYIVWVGFAAVLNFSILILNP